MYVFDISPLMFFLGIVLNTKNVVKLSKIRTLARVDELLPCILYFISVYMYLYMSKGITGSGNFQSLRKHVSEMSPLQNVLSLWDVCALTPVWNWPSLHVEEFLLTTEAESPSSVTWYITMLVVIALL